MALIGNRSVLLKSPGRFLSGTIASIERNNFSTAGQIANRFQSLSRIFAGIPSGHLPPSSWSMARTAGALSAINEATFALTPDALNLAEGRNIAGDTSFTFTLPNADLQLVVSADGSATFTFSQSGALAGALDAAGSATATFTVGAATLGALIDAIAAATFALTGTATPTAIGTLAGDITPFTELSPENLANAVWTRIIESGFTAEEIMRLLASVAVGKTDIDTSGIDPVVTFRDLDDTKDRVTATMLGSERATVVLDAA